MRRRGQTQRRHQRGGLSRLSRVLDSKMRVHERGLWIAKRPQGPRAIEQGRHGRVLTESRCQDAMLGGIVKFDRPVEMCARLLELTRVQKRGTHQTMPGHEWAACSLLLGAVQELRRKRAHSVAIEGDIICDPESIEDGK